MIREFRQGGIIGWDMGRGSKPWLRVSCYLVGDTLIDSGTPHCARELLAALRPYEIRQIYVTHHHEDHSGNAGLIARERGIPVFAPSRAKSLIENGFPIKPYQQNVWGIFEPYQVTPLDVFGDYGEATNQLESSVGSLTLLPAPGHSWDMTVVHWNDGGTLFSADLFLAEQVRYARYDEILSVTVKSLQHAVMLDFDSLACAHRPVWTNGRQALQKKLDWLGRFIAEVQDLYRQGDNVFAVRDKIFGGEDWRAVMWTRDDASALNMVRSALGRHVVRPEVAEAIRQYHAHVRAHKLR